MMSSSKVVRHADPWSNEWRSYWRPHLIAMAEHNDGVASLFDATAGDYAGGVVTDEDGPCFWWNCDVTKFPRHNQLTT